MDETVKKPSLSVLVPTRGGGDLSFLMHTIATQDLVEGDEILVIGDGKQYEVQQLIDAIGPPFRYVETNATGDWGHTQLNYGLELARGDFILGTDDDDGYFSRAFEVVRDAVKDSASPHLFRFYSNDRLILWRASDNHEIAPALVGGHNLVAPNIDGKKGAFKSVYRGDFDWVRSVLESYPKRDWVWRPELLTRQRPNRDLLAWPVRTDNQYETLRVLRNECRDGMTQHRDEISGAEQQVFAQKVRDREIEGWAYLYTARRGPNSEAVGWSFLQRKNGKMYPSYGIAAAHRGRGYGKPIIQHALDAAMGDCYGEAFESNKAILHLDLMLGWREVGRHDSPHGEVVDLFRPYPPE